MERSKYVAVKASEALLKEVNLSPKPGLVDQLNNGSHNDMDLQTFYDSARAISPFFEGYFLLGYTHLGTPAALFEKVRDLGACAEEEMMLATNQINTHKGANFSFAVIIGSIGNYYQENEQRDFTEETTNFILNYTKEMCSGLSTRDFRHLTNKQKLTNGEKLFLNKGIKGIRGEAESGYESLKNILLPSLRKHAYLEEEERYLRGFIDLMSEVEDSNIYHRGGEEGLLFLKEESKKIQQLEGPKAELVDHLHSLDKKMITKNLSPGGSADLLSLGIFLSSLERN